VAATTRFFGSDKGIQAARQHEDIRQSNSAAGDFGKTIAKARFRDFQPVRFPPKKVRH